MKKLKTVFVVEDSRILSEIIALQLKIKFECDVITFENGEHINSNIKKYSPDLIVLDYNFNDIKTVYSNGLEILIQLRKTYKTPVIVFSGQRDKEKALEIIHAGATDYISKDDDDFMTKLLKSSDDIFKVQASKGSIVKLKNKLKSVYFYLLLLLIIGATVFAFSN